MLAEVPPGAPSPTDDLSAGAGGPHEGRTTTTPSTAPLGDGAAGIDQTVMFPPRATSPMTTRSAAESRHSRARETTAGSTWTGRGADAGGCVRATSIAGVITASDDTPQLAASGVEAPTGAATGVLASAGCAARLWPSAVAACSDVPNSRARRSRVTSPRAASSASSAWRRSRRLAGDVFAMRSRRSCARCTPYPTGNPGSYRCLQAPVRASNPGNAASMGQYAGWPSALSHPSPGRSRSCIGEWLGWVPTGAGEP